ncbi:Stk1 family PASTA domain-containing Ser/Thr kinase [Halobacillus litoralis]|uniref:Stk1 family PASTA domain-containing Ser/Thr kinase n=1 Tax=Halobacillus litoralis TaxID=45668 RepID=UPI001CD2CFD4|nr:Stk1 family PASTA domain-containing Ser/Thr kinase [Halobacillus litoralis]MCA0969250.1 Stk1 family PASTA domain-containing Ser/Thr kinase [Halobacillus litoralis]
MLQNRLLNDRYRIKEMIGGGGMANVYLGHDTILERDVAVKVLRLDHGNDEEFIARFHREAQSATSLSHPNIVDIYDVGEEEELYYMVMEYVDGMTLKQYIQQFSPIDITTTIDMMKQVASAIHHAHENGIVHRDIKPQNILVDHYGHVKVTDFGIAMALSGTSLTQTNSVLGSVHYLSPEQARGGMATKKSDVYALGIVFFELLTGRLPFSGESAVSIALKHLQHDTPSLRRWINDLPQSVENIVLKSTAKDPFHRYASVSEMEEDLETCLDVERMNEPAFSIPEDDDEEKTKAIPVIPNHAYDDQTSEQTIIHNQTRPTQPVQDPVKTETEPPKETKKKRKMLPWVLSIVAFLAISGVAALFLLPALTQPADVEIADVTGLEYEEAYTELTELNLNVSGEEIFSEDVAEGLVIRTDPAAGSTVKEDTSVTIYYSRGRETVEFEDYTGQNFSLVETELAEQGFENIRQIQRSSEEEEGTILEHVSPRAGQQVIPEETPVIFEVSSGPPTVDLPRLSRMTVEEATAELEDLGLEVAISEEYSPDVPEGEVISQDPSPGTAVREGTTVELTISRGPEPEPEPEPEEETPPPEEDPQPRSIEREVTVPFDEGLEQEEQRVIIYVGDSENNIEEPFREETITEETSFTIPLTITPGSEATYRIQREGENIINETISYEEAGENNP